MGREAKLTAALRSRDTRQGLIALAGQTATVGVRARDRFGAVIEEGDVVLYDPAATLVFQVAAVRNVPVPGTPRGAMELTLTTQFPIRVPPEVPVTALVVVGARAPKEAGDGGGTSAGAPGGGDGADGDAGGRDGGAGGDGAGRGAAAGGGAGGDAEGGERGAGGGVSGSDGRVLDLG